MALTKKKLDQIENMTSDIEEALTGSASPSSSNLFLTASAVQTQPAASSVSLSAGSPPVTLFTGSVPSWAKYIDIEIGGGDRSTPGSAWAASASWTIDVDAFTVTGSYASWSGTDAGLGHQSRNGTSLTGLVGGATPLAFAYMSSVFDINLVAYSGAGSTLTIDIETFTGGTSAAHATVRYRSV